MSYLKTISFTLLLLLILNSVANSQTGDTGLLITVRDQFEGVISEAQITILSGEEKPRQSRTNRQGTSQFNKLKAGNYKLIVEAAGFQKYEKEDFVIRENLVNRVDIVLEVAPVESNVDVGADETVDAERLGAATVLNEREIQDLPDDPEELERYLKRLAETVTGEENLPLTVNGVQGGKLPPKALIQQVRINQNIFSAQYESTWGGGIEVFTQTSVDKFSGSAGFNFADARLNAIDPFVGRRIPSQSRSFFFNLSGPLGKKTGFSIGANRNDNDSSSGINAVTLDANLQPVAFRDVFETPRRSNGVYGSITSDITKKHKIYLSANIFGSRSEGGVSELALPSRATDSKYRGIFLDFSETYLVNKNIVNQTQFRFSNFKSETTARNDDVALNVLDSFLGGGAQRNSADRNSNFSLNNDTTWQMGKYSLGFGFRMRGEKITQISASNFGGTYTFSGRLAPVLDENNNPVSDASGNIVRNQISSLESYRRTLLLQRLGFSSQRIRELGGGANQFTISGGNPELRISQYDWSFYLQNSYRLSETLTTSFGLRYENQSNIDSNLNFAPRFGFIWSPKAKDKQNPLFTLPRISFGYGVFYNRFPIFSTISLRQASDSDRAQYLITETDILNVYPNVPSVDLLERFALPRTQRFFADDLDTSRQSLMTLTASKKLPKGFNLNANFSMGRLSRLSFTQNINAPLAGTFNPLNPVTAARPFGNVGNIYETQSVGRSRNMRLSVGLTFPNSPKQNLSFRYGFTKAESNVVSGSGSPFDPFDFSQELAPTAFDGVHTFGGFFNRQLPFGFSLNTDFSISSGGRFNIFTGRDTNGDGFFAERPAFAKNLNKSGLISTEYGILDPNPSPGEQLIPRNLGKGPSRINNNAYLTKSFKFGEDKANKKPARYTLSFNARVNNIFNIVNKANPIGNMSSPNFLRSITGSAGNIEVTEDGGTIIYSGFGAGAGRSFSFGTNFRF